jgi:hypothetical protein
MPTTAAPDRSGADLQVVDGVLNFSLDEADLLLGEMRAPCSVSWRTRSGIESLRSAGSKLKAPLASLIVHSHSSGFIRPANREAQWGLRVFRSLNDEVLV